MEELDIPVFHDDQHGTAIVTIAALINALKIVDKKVDEIKVVVSGTGAAGSAIIKMLNHFGVQDIIAFNIDGALSKTMTRPMNFLEKEITEITNKNDFQGSLSEAMIGADVFIGVSAPKLVTKEMVASMNSGAIVFPMANPESEIDYQDAIDAGAAVVGTGRSDHPNQINNVLAFPGLFKGAFVAGATKITENMKLAAAKAIAEIIPESELTNEYIIPSAFNQELVDVIIREVAETAVQDGVIRA